ncbi:MAG: hypothetical protein IPN19_01150 [Elusimicrobia bacterium]|nr:hypothetical protein [Elusimicrobiota bacterium]
MIPLSQYAAGMGDAGKANSLKPPLSTTPPRSYFRETPAKLLIVDGEVKTQPIEEGNLLQVVNTADVLVKDPATSFIIC